MVVKVYFKRGDLPQKEILAHKARTVASLQLDAFACA